EGFDVFSGAAQRGGGEVHRRHPPAARGEPDGVASLAAARVQCGAGRQIPGLRHQLRVGPPAPDRGTAAVTVFPVLLVEFLGHDGFPSVIHRPWRRSPATCSQRRASFSAENGSRCAATARRVSSAIRSALIWAPAPAPADAEETTWATGSVTL